MWIDRQFSDFFILTSREFSWWSYRQNSRAKNLGWRINYHFITKSLENQLERALILKEAVASDHCPVFVEIKI